MSVEVKEIKIRVGEQVVRLTEGEARELKGKLDGLLGAPYVPYTPYVPYIPYVPSWPFSPAPTWTDNDPVIDWGTTWAITSDVGANHGDV